MRSSSLALVATFGVAMSAGAASAAVFTYQFGGNGIQCYANSSVDTPACSTTAADYDNPTLFTPIPPSAPSVSVEGKVLDVGVNEVNHFQPGLGIAADGSAADPWIGVFEDLIVKFSDAVQVLGFELSGRMDGGGTATFGTTDDVSPDTFSYSNEFYGVDNETPQSFTLGGPLAGSSFVFSNEESQSVVPQTGFAVYSITVRYEEDDPQVIPVPPAAPLLGGALALLAWRARRSKRA